MGFPVTLSLHSISKDLLGKNEDCLPLSLIQQFSRLLGNILNKTECQRSPLLYLRMVGSIDGRDYLLFLVDQVNNRRSLSEKPQSLSVAISSLGNNL